MSVALAGLWVAIQAQGEDLACTPDLTGLSFGLRQVARQAGDAWRKTESRVGFTSTVAWARREACAPFQHVPASTRERIVDGLAITDFSPHVFRFGSGADVALSDVIHQRVGDFPGAFWLVISEARVYSWRAGVLEVDVREIPITDVELEAEIG